MASRIIAVVAGRLVWFAAESLSAEFVLDSRLPGPRLLARVLLLGPLPLLAAWVRRRHRTGILRHRLLAGVLCGRPRPIANGVLAQFGHVLQDHLQAGLLHVRRLLAHGELKRALREG